MVFGLGDGLFDKIFVEKVWKYKFNFLEFMYKS